MQRERQYIDTYNNGFYYIVSNRHVELLEMVRREWPLSCTFLPSFSDNVPWYLEIDYYFPYTLT